jgi:hypothetical protein
VALASATLIFLLLFELWIVCPRIWREDAGVAAAAGFRPAMSMPSVPDVEREYQRGTLELYGIH